MEYNFKYKSKFEKRNTRQRINKFFSDFLFFLYGNWLFKKFRLDRNEFLRSYVLFGKNRNIPKLNESKIPKILNLDIYSIAFLDCVELEDSQKLKNKLIKLVSRYKGGFLSDDPVRKLNKSFQKFDSDYKTTSWGSLFFNDTKENEELDLIDGISYGYVKGAQSHFVITYTVYPSEKFKKLFIESLNKNITIESKINFKSLKQIIKTKRLFSSIGSDARWSGYWTDKLFNEIAFQLKTEVVCNLQIGVFNLSNDVLFPRIVSFEYDQDDFNSYQEEVCNKLNISRYQYYVGSDIIFSLKNVDYSKKSSFGIEIFIPYKTDEEKVKDQFNNVSYLSSNYTQAIASYWVLINFSSLRKQDIVELRKRTFEYIRKNRISLFLRKVIKLKNNLTLNWISFERVRKDFSSDVFKHTLYEYGIPEALNQPWFQGAKPDDFKNALISNAENISIDIKDSYEEILELHSHIGEDNLLRASMRLQRLLFFIAIAGIVLALYGSNSEWCNAHIECLLNDFNIYFHTVKNQ